jgi:hypothetical protein
MENREHGNHYFAADLPPCPRTAQGNSASNYAETSRNILSAQVDFSHGNDSPP